MFGARDSHGDLMRKGWRIATNIQELACLEQYMCTHERMRGQSRGKSLKSATFEYTDLVHRCFKNSNPSLPAAVVKRALPAIMATTSYASADEETKAETLKIFEDRFRQIIAWLLRGHWCCDQWRAWAAHCPLLHAGWMRPELEPFVKTYKEQLATFTGVQILISDSTLNFVSGSKRKPERFDLADHFQAHKPSYCQRYHHECIWGAELDHLLKPARIAIRSLKAQPWYYDRLVAVVWSGNELVGKDGIEDSSPGRSRHARATTTRS